jgi:quinol monooxygenase YgiN
MSTTDLHPLAATVKAKLPDPTKPFSLLVLMTVKPEKVAGFPAFFADAVASTRKEPGNLAYDLSRDADHPRGFILVERWKSLADLDSHLKTPVIDKLLAGFPENLDGDAELKVGLPVGE